MTNKTTHNSNFRFGPFNLPDEKDLIAISENAKKNLNTNSRDSRKQKTTYSISPLTTALIKDFAEECGVTQGTIIELAPLLFRILAADSMKRRTNEFSAIKKISEQILSNLETLDNLAPHLKAFSDFIKQAVIETINIEASAIKEKNYKGVDASETEILSQVKGTSSQIAFHKDLQKILARDETLEHLFNSTKK